MKISDLLKQIDDARELLEKEIAEFLATLDKENRPKGIVEMEDVRLHEDGILSISFYTWGEYSDTLHVPVAMVENRSYNQYANERRAAQKLAEEQSAVEKEKQAALLRRIMYEKLKKEFET